MNKRLLTLASLSVLALVSCGGGSGGSGEKAQPRDLGPDFNAEYNPDMTAVKDRTGQIDVCLVFEDTAPAWRALGEEYKRLTGGNVTVNINDGLDESAYQTRINYEITNPRSDWDIVQGNLILNSLSDTCINMYSNVTTNKNPYAGNKTWLSVLNEEAYITDKSASNLTTYVINSESLQTAWFVNTQALKEAGERGYKNADGEVANPKTWEDLLLLCEKMVAAGYQNPLGLSLASDSVTASQFTWLLRVYGDYYFRVNYDDIMVSDTYEVDLEDENPEGSLSFKISQSKLFNSILDENSTHCYVGPKSEKYQDFLGQFAAAKNYIDVNAFNYDFSTMRNYFYTQSKGKSSPQIFLDYSGKGLVFFGEDSSLKDHCDFFDYPTMFNEYTPEETLTRDVGGNGGYLSVLSHSSAQNELNIDFMKFVMSPYGQSIYYEALSGVKNAAPKGLTTVKNDLVVVPSAWRDYFQTEKISFTGLSDNNPYISNLVRYLSTNSKNLTDSVSLWKRLLCMKSIDEETFGEEWAASLAEAWDTYATNNHFTKDAYLDRYWGNDDYFYGR